jgi:glycosyltransferase involved in cell wall biosynthesis
LSTYKGVDVLIRSMTHLRDRPCTLLIAGDGADRAPLQRLVETEGLGDRVHLLGFIGEKSMAAHWALADVFAFHSYYETFGMVLAEAMHAGKPIVSVDCTAIPEVVAHEETGLLVAPGDPKAFAAAVRRLLDEPGTRERLAAAGRRRAEREFTWNRLAQRYEDVFTQAVKR